MLKYTDGIYDETQGYIYYIPNTVLNGEGDLLDFICNTLTHFKSTLSENQFITDITYSRDNGKIYIYIAEVTHIWKNITL